MPGENVDLSSDPPTSPRASSASTPESASSRPFIGVQFACCDLYSRIYLNRQRTAYAGACPRCAKQVHFKVGPGGTDSRFFTVY